MPDYNLHGLSTRSFEQLIQALATPIFGPNIVIFGDGPDGGREATFNGNVPYPSAKQGWNGYGVIQAKFLQRSTSSSGDGKWALGQLAKELGKYPSKIAKVPEFYLFVTNVVLTPVSDKGSRDRAEVLMAQEAKRLKIRGWDIWDYEKIRVLLDNNRDVAKAYAAGITTGDVLSALIENMASSPAFRSTISNFLQKELLADQYARLQQAGHDPEEKMQLSRVFIDLPVSNDRVYAPPADKLPGFIELAMEMACTRFDRKSSPNQDRGGRYVLLGGPGQGKTTVGQYLCQLYRAALLQEETNLTIEAKNVVTEIAAKCRHQDLELPRFKRFPIRIELKSFAALLASSSAKSLFEHIQQRFQARTNRNIPDGILRQWFATYPWLIVLDGLDEVPVSSNRDQLMNSISDFWIDMSECDADIFVVATSRPQGYSHEFSPASYIHRHLTPLPNEVALKYGKLLTENRYGPDAERAAKVFARLERATKETATARLMQSPLQVTIMTALVDKLGQPPDQRWALFNDYYKTIYDREVERQIPAAEVLRTKRTDVNLIHYRLGLILQMESERRGTTDARLTLASFRKLVEEKLKSEGYEGIQLGEIVDSILTAASDRLVFIVGLEDDRVGFEIRSLQEFMAAEGLMEGSDEVVKERLRHIAPLDSWRQVFLFAAGKCFIERRHLREFIYTLCSEIDLDHNNSGNPVLRVGAALALDLLEEGTAREQPKFERMFAEKALSLLDVPIPNHHLRLAGLYRPHLQREYEDNIRQRLRQIDEGRRLGALTCLLEISKRSIDWAKVEVSKWAHDAKKMAPFYGAALGASKPAGLSTLKEVVLANSRVISVQKPNVEAWWNHAPHQASQKDWYSSAIAILRSPGESLKVSVRVTPEADLSVGVAGLNDELLAKLSTMPSHGPEWEPFFEAAKFTSNPNAESLANAIERLAEPSNVVIHNLQLRLPWPLRCLASCWSRPELAYPIAERIRAGEMGDLQDWAAAEERWEAGVDLEEFCCEVDGLPFGRDIAARGLPPAAIFSIAVDNSRIRAKSVDDLVQAVCKLPQQYGRSAAAAFVTLRAGIYDLKTKTAERVALELLDEAAQFDWLFLTPQLSAALMGKNGWESRLDSLGRKYRFSHAHSFDEDGIRLILDRICSNPLLEGLVRLVAPSAVRSGIAPPCGLDASKAISSNPVDSDSLALYLLSKHWTEAEVSQLTSVISDRTTPERPLLLQSIERSSNTYMSRVRLLSEIAERSSTSDITFRRLAFERLASTIALKQSNLALIPECDLGYLSSA